MKTKAVDNAIRRAAAKHVPLSEVEAEQRGIKVDKDGLVRCRVCGCTEREGCNPPCSWVEVDICSNCVVALKAMVEWAEGAQRPNTAALLREFKRYRASVISRLRRIAKAGYGR